MHSERGIIFGALDIEESAMARRLGFNNDGTTPSFAVPREIGEGEIYHSKPYGDENIVVANVILNGQNEQRYFFKTFEGMNPIEMDSLPRGEAIQQYELFLGNVMQVLNPEFQVTTDQLKERLEELSKEL